MKERIGQYTHREGTYYFPSHLQNYVEDCIKGCLQREKWWKAEKVIREFDIIIKVRKK